jgi:hypothetical protein
MIKYLITLSCLLAACSRPSNEMEQMTHQVLKAKQGVEIDVKPIEKPTQK